MANENKMASEEQPAYNNGLFTYSPVKYFIYSKFLIKTSA